MNRVKNFPALVVAIWVISTSISAQAQCTISQPSDRTQCDGYVTFTATSQSTTVNHHIWYTSTGLALSPTTENAIILGGGSQTAWTSTLTVFLSGNATYSVAASCNTSDKKNVTFTLDPGSVIGLGMNPSLQIPTNLCAGTNVTLTASGGSNYEWRLDDPNKSSPDFLSNPIHPTQSGTYFLKGTNSCGITGTNQIALVFKQPISLLSVPSSQADVCSPAIQSTFTATSTNSNAYTWSIASPGKTLPQIISSSSAHDVNQWTILWNNSFSGAASVTVTAYGCESTIQTFTLPPINIFPLPAATVTPSGPVIIPTGETSAQLSLAHNTTYTYTWYYNSDPITIYTPTTEAIIADKIGTYKVDVFDPEHQCHSTSPPVTVDYENSHNHIIETSIQVPSHPNGSAITEDDLTMIPPTERQRTINYFDGLGFPMQTIKVQASTSGADVITPVLLDGYNRESIKFLPFTAAGTGWYRSNAEIVNPYSDSYEGEAINFYNSPLSKVAVDQVAYSQTFQELSPLGRVVKQNAPGTPWQISNQAEIYDVADKSIKTRYESNGANDVLHFTYDIVNNVLSCGVPGTPEYYAQNSLFVTKILDENNNETLEYKDMAGLIVLKRVQQSLTTEPKKYTNTYYIYDDRRYLLVVLPPEGVEAFLR